MSLPTRQERASKLVSREPLDPTEAKWIRLVKLNYTDPLGVQRVWESAERQSRPKNADIDAVGIVTLLEKETGPELLLQKQYRAPLDKITIEVPAGLIDEGETAEECAVRELREETGYVGVAEKRSTVLYNDPGFCNTNENLVHVRVDMSLPENQNPEPQLEDNEFIECFTVPLNNLLDEIKKLDEQGYAIDARVGLLAEGIELSKRMGLR
ncbi:ADP-ribose pyrophosphatase [Paecilomyces variotii No. 5]|uniref:ADP-ribose pyrophosphatase n=1 Tax=Byssochlamys spectabilis (strain No. 5 / NBRC 109023) TaxID=1356009 RepID=V5FZD0_BYSSN|nr:ADP-ribose pyrophosphatase [Paecilomyces variotii No. 5]